MRKHVGREWYQSTDLALTYSRWIFETNLLSPLPLRGLKLHSEGYFCFLNVTIDFNCIKKHGFGFCYRVLIIFIWMNCRWVLTMDKILQFIQSSQEDQHTINAIQKKVLFISQLEYSWILVGFDRACAPVRYAHPSSWTHCHAERTLRAPPPIAALLLSQK